jgi:uncharacterized protein YqeY
MLRNRIKDALKEAMLAKSQEVVAALRLILAALKDRDIAARGKGNLEGIGDDEILALLQSMIKQRSESIEMYEKGGRLDLAERETKEIATIEQFLPEQIADDELVDAITSVIIKEKGKTLKDMGRVMTALKERYTGRMDFAKASTVVKKQLS